MKTLRIVCPTCGAHLDVDINSGQARCRFCKEIFSLDTNEKTQAQLLVQPPFDAEQMGYDFEQGRQRANVEFTQGFADRIAEARQHMPAYEPEPVYVPQPVYVPEPAPAVPARQGLPIWALVLLWMFCPPMGLIATVATLVRNSSNGRTAATRTGIWTIVVMIWIVLALIGLMY